VPIFGGRSAPLQVGRARATAKSRQKRMRHLRRRRPREKKQTRKGGARAAPAYTFPADV
jgi:hypothetical protein